MIMNNKLMKLARNGSRSAAKAISHQHALERIAAKSIDISTFIDVGAARGAWSLNAEKYWPDAKYHLLEAKELWRSELEKLTTRKAHYSFTMKAVTNTPGAIYFPTEGEAYAGAAFKDPMVRDDLKEVPATTIDHEADTLSLEGPFAIKLDTHGTEIDIFEGAVKALKNTSLICIETYNFIGQKRFPEMLMHLQTLGFRVADIAEPLFRESDATLWQVDFYLLRADHPTFNNFGFS